MIVIEQYNIVRDTEQAVPKTILVFGTTVLSLIVQPYISLNQ